MFPPTCCLTCGMPLGDIYDLFIKDKIAKIETILDKKHISQKMAMACNDLNEIDMLDLFKKYCIIMICCRSTINTFIPFSSISM